MIKIEKDKLYLVTGGSGFLGVKLVQRILEYGGKVRVIARDEGKLIMLKESFPSIEIYPGDISDNFDVEQSVQNVSGIFHLAASKHVGMAETFVRESIKSNVIGSLNLYEATLRHEIEFIISISTDKAAQVSGVYGSTKLLMERLSRQYEKLNSDCEYRVVRYGNVLYSTGSVLCKWKDIIKKGGTIVVTDPEATRFFWTVDSAIDLIFNCLNTCKDSKPYCPEMKSMKISDLLDAMILKYSKNGNSVNINYIGLQPGENLHEKILDDGPYSNEVDMYSIEEILELI